MQEASRAGAPLCQRAQGHGDNQHQGRHGGTQNKETEIHLKWLDFQNRIYDKAHTHTLLWRRWNKVVLLKYRAGDFYCLLTSERAVKSVKMSSGLLQNTALFLSDRVQTLTIAGRTVSAYSMRTAYSLSVCVQPECLRTAWVSAYSMLGHPLSVLCVSALPFTGPSGVKVQQHPGPKERHLGQNHHKGLITQLTGLMKGWHGPVWTYLVPHWFINSLKQCLSVFLSNQQLRFLLLGNKVFLRIKMPDLEWEYEYRRASFNSPLATSRINSSQQGELFLRMLSWKNGIQCNK